jgi:hypothetical protein
LFTRDASALHDKRRLDLSAREMMQAASTRPPCRCRRQISRHARSASDARRLR